MNASANGRAGARDRFAFDRSDRWGLGLLLLLVAAAGSGAWLILPLLAWARGEAIRVPFISPVTVPALDAVGVRYGEGSYDLVIQDPTPAQHLWDLVPGAIWTPIVVAACWQIVQVMRTVGRGEPFAAGNVRRLRTIAALLAFGVPVASFTEMACRGALLGGIDLGGLPPADWLEVPWLPVVAGTTVALIAEAFKAGAQLQRDVDGLV